MIVVSMVLQVKESLDNIYTLDSHSNCRAGIFAVDSPKMAKTCRQHSFAIRSLQLCTTFQIIDAKYVNRVRILTASF